MGKILATVNHSKEILSHGVRIKNWKENSTTHCHDFFEILYVKKGCILHSANDSPYIKMYPGDYIFIDIGSHHSFYIEDATIMNVEFTSQAISKHLPLCNNIFQLFAYSAFSVIGAKSGNFPVGRILHDDGGQLMSYINVLDSEIRQNSNTNPSLLPYVIKHDLVAIILHIALPYINPNRSDNENKYVKKMFEIVAFHYADPNPLTIAANQLSYSPSTLSTLFKRHTGIKYKDYLQHFRIDKAKYLLTHTSANISKISTDVGYADAKFFSRLFKKSEGMTPTEYRCHNRKNMPVLKILDN